MAFAPLVALFRRSAVTPVTPLRGYLDDLSKELYTQADDPDLDQTYEASKARKEDTDRFGVGTWEGFVDFDEFDGGDGQVRQRRQTHRFAHFCIRLQQFF